MQENVGMIMLSVTNVEDGRHWLQWIFDRWLICAGLRVHRNRWTTVSQESRSQQCLIALAPLAHEVHLMELTDQLRTSCLNRIASHPALPLPVSVLQVVDPDLRRLSGIWRVDFMVDKWHQTAVIQLSIDEWWSELWMSQVSSRTKGTGDRGIPENHHNNGMYHIDSMRTSVISIWFFWRLRDTNMVS